MLEPEHEKNLWLLNSQGDLNAREELIIAYRPLVFWIANKIYAPNNNLKQDIIQEGMLALIQAVDKFELERGYKFATFAYYKIHGRIINMLERNEKKAPVPIPDEWIQIAGRDFDGYEYNDDWLDVERSLNKLQGCEAEVVKALFLEGQKPQDVAVEKKLDISHVYRLKRGAINKIRHILGLEGGV